MWSSRLFWKLFAAYAALTLVATMTFVLEKEIAEIHASAGSSSNQEQPRRRKKKNLEHEQRPAVQVTLAAMRGRVFWR